MPRAAMIRKPDSSRWRMVNHDEFDRKLEDAFSGYHSASQVYQIGIAFASINTPVRFIAITELQFYASGSQAGMLLRFH